MDFKVLTEFRKVNLRTDESEDGYIQYSNIYEYVYVSILTYTYIYAYMGAPHTNTEVTHALISVSLAMVCSLTKSTQL